MTSIKVVALSAVHLNNFLSSYPTIPIPSCVQKCADRKTRGWHTTLNRVLTFVHLRDAARP
ncbi:Uncharacterized protein APZ42_016893 [Daphnia magna]|uniref:Uncharacterized protein n=1 Tax=Daphnia magna TaxID=35525 RepID=A0A165A862_9CRUS|nr:Uncharacterized protein APZ42_016893 [Daphnia magna]